MKLPKDAKRLRMLYKIDRIIAKKYSLDNLTANVKSEIRSAYKNTKVHVAIGELKPSTGERVINGKKLTGGPFVTSLSNLLMQKKKSLILGKDLQKFCKKHGIKPVRKSVKSIMGIPVVHRNQTVGAIILENTKQAEAYDDADEAIVTALAVRLGAEIVNDELLVEKTRLETEIRQLALFDPLTKLPNQRYFDLIFEMEIKKAKGYSRQLSLAMIDLDRFRNLSTRYGKKFGDALLMHVAQTLKQNVRDTDFIARLQGVQCVILLPEALNEAAVNVAERVRVAVEKTALTVKGSGKRKVTISVGVVTYPSSAESLPALLEQADKALKRAKQLGGNQVVAL
ncbi:MAG: sensor domain-containing diguanylate cyclase [candidate division WOR-3 bacterium]|jgi:diguanylate cyclase (GGDEF)-like protein